MVLSAVAKRNLTGTLGERVRLLLGEQGKSVTWLADQIGMHRVNASRIVNGHVPDPTVSVVRAIATALGVSVGELLDDPCG